MTTEEIVDRRWDAIVIGTGMGGATIGYALASAGKSVLYCEKGAWSRSCRAIKGRYAEECLVAPHGTDSISRTIRQYAGREWETIADHSQSRTKTFIPFVGSGTGGSTALYGMALERFFPSDFTPGICFPDIPDSNIPERWPITYDELSPYYGIAENLFRVRGSADVLRGTDFHPSYRAAPQYSDAAAELFHFLEAQGMHPYRLPLACDYAPECETCQGFLCSRECKNDSTRICLEPALNYHGAELLEECEVERLEATNSQVTSVIARHKEQKIVLTGKVIILAAGALFTPRILLQSASADWPQGLANKSGMVGRNLMRHFIDLYVIRPKTKCNVHPPAKELAFNDLYFSAGRKLGSVQGFGALPPAAHLVQQLGHDLRQGPFRYFAKAFAIAAPLISAYLERRLSGSQIFATVVEDLPYAENRVELGRKGELKLYYTLRKTERKRIAEMRNEIRRILKPYHPMLLKQAENNERLAHACGTCRMGEDPSSSVVSKDNRAHDLENLYIVDASFFPSSGGINPSLTIAANSLRVADLLI